MPRRLALALTALFLAACRGDDPSSSGKPVLRGGPTGDVTIRVGSKGGPQVDGAPLKGDPKACAAFKSCCSSPNLALFCGLTQAANKGDCVKSLKEVKQYAAESHVKTPAGCK